jgi:arylsulfatase I/J
MNSEGTPIIRTDWREAWPHKPNIILWLVDDQGWGNAGYNNGHMYTPHMDSMAAEGIILDRHYTYAWCAPSRSALMTGRMPHDGFQTTGQLVPQDVTMIAQVMRDAGYSTHHVGKWHLGVMRPWEYPTSRGFDTSLGFMGGSTDYVTQRPTGDDWICSGVDLQKNGGPATGLNGTFSGNWFKREIDDVILHRKDASKPLFLFVALQAMHTPSPGADVLAPFMVHYHELGYDFRFSLSAGLITHADWLLGKLNESLYARDMWGNTLIIHLSDNGGQVTGSDSDEVQGNNWPLRGMKKSLFEGGVRTPAFVSGGAVPQLVRGSRRDGYIHLADWFATLTNLAGSGFSPPPDSHSMLSYLAGARTTSPRKDIVLAAGNTGLTVNYAEAVISGEWKLINGSIPCGWDSWQGPVFPNASNDQPRIMLRGTQAEMHETISSGDDGCTSAVTTYLFNIMVDPHEANNLAFSPFEQHKSKLAELFDVLAANRAAANPFELDGDRALNWRFVRGTSCESFRDENRGFLGPFMAGKTIYHSKTSKASNFKSESRSGSSMAGRTSQSNSTAAAAAATREASSPNDWVRVPDTAGCDCSWAGKPSCLASARDSSRCWSACCNAFNILWGGVPTTPSPRRSVGSSAIQKVR